MASPNTFTTDKKNATNGFRKRWWLEPVDSVARELSAYCVSLEDGQQRERYLGFIFEKLATGRDQVSYGIQMDGRIKGDIASALFSPPSENYVAIAVDVFANKIGKNRPFLKWSTTAMDDTDLREACDQATDYAEQIFNDIGTWPLVESSFKHGSIHGCGPVLVDGEHGIDGEGGKVTLTKLYADEILLDPTSGSNPPNFQIRLFTHRDTVIRKYLVKGKGKAAESEYEEKKKRIEDLPGCKPGFFTLDVGYQDILALCIGFYIPGDGSPGRKTVCVGDILLEDDQNFKDDLPVASFIYEPIDDSYKGQGIPEQMLPLQREVDRIADNLAEHERRFCWAKWGYRRDDQIDPDQLIGNSNVEYNEEPPKSLDVPEPPEKLYDQLEKKGQQALARVGISQNQAQGTTEPGINAGIAIIASSQIDDVRHVAVAQRLENFVEHLGKLIIQAAGKYKPTVYTSGKKLPWPDVVNDQKKCKMTAFKMSGLPQSIPGRRQALYDMWTGGEIDNKTYRRALGANELRSTESLITVGDDFINWQLDMLIKKGAKFDPPPPFVDYPRALELSQKRLMREIMNGVDKKQLQLIAQYMQMCAQRVQELQATQSTATQPGAPAVPGVQQTATPQPGAEQAPMQG